jgi:hypothetical protein
MRKNPHLQCALVDSRLQTVASYSENGIESAEWLFLPVIRALMVLEAEPARGE